jgi:hypothetical protein
MQTCSAKYTLSQTRYIYAIQSPLAHAHSHAHAFAKFIPASRNHCRIWQHSQTLAMTSPPPPLLVSCGLDSAFCLILSLRTLWLRLCVLSDSESAHQPPLQQILIQMWAVFAVRKGTLWLGCVFAWLTCTLYL